MIPGPLPSRTFGVAPVIPIWALHTARVAVGAFIASQLWEVKKKIDYNNAYQWWGTMRHPQGAIYRKPEYSQIPTGDLQKAKGLMDYVMEDYWTEPLTNTLYERQFVEQELLRRSGKGGMLMFIGPEMSPDLSIPWQEIGWATAIGLEALTLFGKGVMQVWGLFNGPPKKGPTQGNGGLTVEGVYSKTGRNQVVFTGRDLGTVWNAQIQQCQNTTSQEYTKSRWVDGGIDTVGWELSGSARCGGSVLQELVVRHPNGASTVLDYTQSGDGFVGVTGYIGKFTLWTDAADKQAASPAVLPSTPRPWLPARPVEPEPELEPQPELEPGKAPPLLPSVVPGESPVPTTPGPGTAPVTPALPTPVLPKAPVIPGSTPVNGDGTLPKPVPAPPTVTNPDWHYPVPGKPPVVGNGPQPKPEEIAKELGRLEQKLGLIMNPNPDTLGEWWERAKLVYELLSSVTAGRTYTLTEKCSPDGTPPRTVQVSAPGSLGAIGVLLNRVDALAELMDGQLGLRQQVCPPARPTPQGDWVTVNFDSAEDSPQGEYRLRKVLRYRDQTGSPVDDHIDHWLPFVWRAGPVVVISKNLSWGTPQVWAESEEEGRRVLEHAAAIAGVDLSDEKHEWVVTQPRSSRFGMPGTMRVAIGRGGAIRVSKRAGSDGRPENASLTIDP